MVHNFYLIGDFDLNDGQSTALYNMTLDTIMRCLSVYTYYCKLDGIKTLLLWFIIPITWLSKNDIKSKLQWFCHIASLIICEFDSIDWSCSSRSRSFRLVQFSWFQCSFQLAPDPMWRRLSNGASISTWAMKKKCMAWMGFHSTAKKSIRFAGRA